MYIISFFCGLAKSKLNNKSLMLNVKCVELEMNDIYLFTRKYNRKSGFSGSFAV